MRYTLFELFCMKEHSSSVKKMKLCVIEGYVHATNWVMHVLTAEIVYESMNKMFRFCGQCKLCTKGFKL